VFFLDYSLLGLCDFVFFFFFFLGLVQSGAWRWCSGVEALFFGFVWVEEESDKGGVGEKKTNFFFFSEQ